MLSLATSMSKRPSAQPPDPNIRLGFGETAAKRSLFFVCVFFANIRMMAHLYGPAARCKPKMMILEKVGLALLYPALDGAFCSWPSWIEGNCGSASV